MHFARKVSYLRDTLPGTETTFQALLEAFPNIGLFKIGQHMIQDFSQLIPIYMIKLLGYLKLAVETKIEFIM